MSLVEFTVQQYLSTLASSAPAPGGGSASALCGAQGAGLAAMVVGLTLGKKRYEAYQSVCESILPMLTQLQHKLTEQIDLDTQAFEQVSAAFSLGTFHKTGFRQVGHDRFQIFLRNVLPLCHLL